MSVPQWPADTKESAHQTENAIQQHSMQMKTPTHMTPCSRLAHGACLRSGKALTKTYTMLEERAGDATGEPQ